MKLQYHSISVWGKDGTGPKTVLRLGWQHESGLFTIHRCFKTGRWYVTHVASGRMITKFAKFRHAREFCTSMAAHQFPVPWDTNDLCALQANKEDTDQIIERIKAV